MEKRKRERLAALAGALIATIAIPVAIDQGYLKNPYILPMVGLLAAVIYLWFFLTSETAVTFGLRIKRGTGKRHPMLATAAVVGIGAVLGGALAWAWWIGLEKSKENLALLASQATQAPIETPPKIERPTPPVSAESRTLSPAAVIHAQLSEENAPGQALVQVKNTGERAIFTATAQITGAVEHATNRPFPHGYPLRWTVNNQHELSLENGARGQLLIASTTETPRRRPSDTPLYELILESYQGGTPLRPGIFHWNGGEADSAVRIFLEVTVSLVGHGAIAEHFVVSSMKWGGIKIEKASAKPSLPSQTPETAAPVAPSQPPSSQSAGSPQVQSIAAPVDWETYRRREAARERYIAFILMAPTAGDYIEAIRRFGEDMQVAADLFGEDVYRYLDTIYKKAGDLRSVREQKKTAFARRLPQRKIEGLASAENTLVAWFTDQYGELRARLAPFFNLSNQPPALAAPAFPKPEITKTALFVKMFTDPLSQAWPPHKPEARLTAGFLNRQFVVLRVTNESNRNLVNVVAACKFPDGEDGLCRWSLQTGANFIIGGRHTADLSVGDSRLLVAAQMIGEDKLLLGLPLEGQPLYDFLRTTGSDGVRFIDLSGAVLNRAKGDSEIVVRFRAEGLDQSERFQLGFNAGKPVIESSAAMFTVATNDPRALWEWLSSLKALPQEDAVQELIGKEVEWEGELQSLSRRDATEVGIKAWIDTAKRTYFLATVQRVPELDGLDPGNSIKVAGTITLISLLERYIMLDSARVIF